MTELSALNSLDRVANLFTTDNGHGNTKVSFAKIHKALFNPDGSIVKAVVPHHNTGSIHGFGYADSSSNGCSTNI